MALFKPYKITSDKLEDLAIQEGQIVITTDTKKLYVDVSATERIEITADAEVDTSVFVTKEDADADYAAISHTHDDRYYTESEVDSKLADKANATHTHAIGDVNNLQETIEGLETDIAGKANTSHTHDDRYFTETEVTEKLATKADTGHQHVASDVTSGTFSLDRIPTITDAKISGLSASKLTGTIPTANLPSYVDDVVEGATTEDFPETGEAGKIYVATSTNKTYRWGGSSYVEISASLALGTTSSTAFRGDYGNVAYTHATAKGAAFGSGLYKITTNAQGHVTAATAVTKNDITALGIPAQDTNTNTTYTLSKSGSTITLSGSDGSSTSVTDANTTYSLGSFGITATAAELNKLDGFTGSAAKLNFTNNVTSDIQSQLNGKAPKAHASSATTYGVGTGTNYGHVKVIDDPSLTFYPEGTQGVAVTPFGIINQLHNLPQHWFATGNTQFGTSTINSIAYGKGIFVAVGDSGKIASSYDGKGWAAALDTKFGSVSIKSIAFNGITFAAVGNSGKGASSNDGMNWSSVNLGIAASNMTCIAHGLGLFVAGGNTPNIVFSSNGVSWSRQSIPLVSVAGIAFGNSRCVLAGQYNSDGAVTYNTKPDGGWTSYTILPFDDVTGIAYGKGKFVVIGQGGNLAYAEDVTRWTRIYLNISFTRFLSIYYDGEKFNLGGNNGFYAYSYDGVNWTILDKRLNNNTSIFGFAHNDIITVAIGNQGQGSYSYKV